MSTVSCKCGLRCFDALSQAQRQRIFDHFWKLESFDIQNAYLCGAVKALAVKRRYSKRAQSRRNTTRVYYVHDGRVSVRVCKTAFLRIHGISNGRLCRVLKSAEVRGGTPKRDERGRHPPGNKTSDEKIEGVKEHIKSFPQYSSHYSRRDNPNRRYLSSDLSIAKLYCLYKEECSANGRDPVSEWVYRKVFNESFNLKFGR